MATTTTNPFPQGNSPSLHSLGEFAFIGNTQPVQLHHAVDGVEETLQDHKAQSIHTVVNVQGVENRDGEGIYRAYRQSGLAPVG